MKKMSKPGEMFQAHMKKKKKLSLGNAVGAIKTGAKLVGETGKALLRNSTGKDTKNLAKSWSMKKGAKKKKTKAKKKK